MQAAGFEICSQEKQYTNIYEYMTKSREEITINEVFEKIKQVEACFSKNKCATKELEDIKAELAETTRDIKTFVIKIGSLLIFKLPDTENKQLVKTKNLSISGLIHLDKNPLLIKDPTRLIEEINSF
jgi:NTP pyrophosphatase (non-canonical NTP hydrolase)